MNSFKGEEEWSVLEFVASMLSTLYAYVDEKNVELKQKYQAFAYDLYVIGIKQEYNQI